MRQIKFTKEGLVNLKAEYEELENMRPNAVKTLSSARELGDLSENSLYHAAKSNLRSIDSKMHRISKILKLAKIVSAKKYWVEQSGKKITYEIVGDYEADPKNHKISANSPIGSVLLGKSEGDIADIRTPSGTTTLKILKISK